MRGRRLRVAVKSRQNEAIRVESGGEWSSKREIVTKHRAIHRFSGCCCSTGSGFEIPIHRNREPMNTVWNAWGGPNNKPPRACVEAALAWPDALVEVMAVAAK